MSLTLILKVAWKLAIPRPLEPFLRCRALPVQVAGWAGGLCVHRVAVPESDSW